MATVPQWFAYAVAAFILLVSLRNPGGGILALFIASVIVAIAITAPFVKEYVLNASKGKWSGRKSPQREQEGEQ